MATCGSTHRAASLSLFVRVPASELQSALATPTHRMKSPSSSARENSQGSLGVSRGRKVRREMPNPQLVVYHSQRGVPRRPGASHFGHRPPIVSIRSIEADRICPLRADRTRAPRPQTLEIRYFGVHLTDPDRVTYRYRLEGSATLAARRAHGGHLHEPGTGHLHISSEGLAATTCGRRLSLPCPSSCCRASIRPRGSGCRASSSRWR